MKHRTRIWQWRSVLLTAPGITVLILLLRLSGGLQFLEWAMFDQFVRLRPVEPRDSRITIVGITESDVQRYGTPLTDDRLAELLEKLKRYQPQSIGLDLYRDIPVGKGYDRLTKVFRSTPNLIGVQKIVGDPAIEAVAPSPVLKELGQIAANDVMVDSDGKIRRGLLSLTEKDATIPSFSALLAIMYLESKGVTPEELPDSSVKLGNKVVTPFQPNDGGYIRAAEGGYQTLIHYRGGRGSFEQVSVQQVLEGQVRPEQLKNRIVLIGATAESLKDSFLTPYEQPMWGVEIHATLISQLLDAALVDRPLIQSWSEWQETAWIFLWASIGAIVVWTQRSFRKGRLSLSLLIAIAVLISGCYLAFLASWWIPIVPTALAFSGSAIVITASIAQSSTQLRKTLGRYLTDEVVAQLLETPEGLKLQGERRKVTVLFSDLRGFTQLSEQLPPEEIVRMLNLYLSVMTKVIKAYGGTINDLTGDGIVIFFGAPLQRSDDTERAVACAIAMQLAMKTVNEQNQAANLPQLEMGIGINTGEVIVGNIGSEEHTKYTAIGSHVNLAARIESFTLGGQVLISPSTWEEVSAIAKIEGQTEVKMKGVSTPVTLYEVIAIAGKHSLSLQHEQLEFIDIQIPLYGTMLEGKHLSDVEFAGKMIRIAGKIAEIQTDTTLPPFSNVKLLVESSIELYAKVLNRRSDQGFYVQLTTRSTEFEQLLK